MGRMAIPKTLATGSVVGASTAVRVSFGWFGVAAQRTPLLVELAVKGLTGGSGAPTAQFAFRDELLALARESAEVSWRELRRGVDDLDQSTRPDERPGPRRPYRAKP